MNHNPTVLEIHSKALIHNLSYFRSKLREGVGMMGVVKASGYGSDGLMVAKTLVDQGIDYLAVAYADEGILLRENGIQVPILVLHPQVDNLSLILKYRLEPNIYSFKVLDHFLQQIEKEEYSAYPCHLKFNTGLNRLGFTADDITDIFEKIHLNHQIKIESIFSHLMASEDPDEKDYTLKQIEEFNQVSAIFKQLFGYLPRRHMTNTSGILNYPQAHFDMVRIGLGLYGFSNDAQLDKKLICALRLSTRISQIHHLKKGDNLGYNRGFTATETMRTATLPVGHADGLFRSYKGSISCWINEQKAPLVGNVCMDMIMIDVTDIACDEGDEAILIKDQNDVYHMAEAASTISYEILTSFSSRIRRVLI